MLLPEGSLSIIYDVGQIKIQVLGEPDAVADVAKLLLDKKVYLQVKSDCKKDEQFTARHSLVNIPRKTMPIEKSEEHPDDSKLTTIENIRVKYKRLPADFQGQVRDYVKAHDGCDCTEMCKDLGVNKKTAAKPIEKMVIAGLLIKEKTNPTVKTSPLKLHPPKPAKTTTEEKPGPAPKIPSNTIDFLKAESSKKEASKVDVQALKSTSSLERLPSLPAIKPMPNGNDKGNIPYRTEEGMRAYILKTIGDHPGRCLEEICHDGDLPRKKVRDILIDFEDEYKIERDMKSTSIGVAKTVYYLKGQKPRKVE